MLGILGATVSLLLVSIVSCKGPTSTIPPAPGWVYPYWEQAQNRLVDDGVVGAREVHADEFRFLGHRPNCADTGGGLTGYWEPDLDYCVWGTFQPPRIIHYSDVYRHVVIHEAEHAILYKLGYDCWSEIDTKESGCP
jgi:hypothetical protein